MSKLYPLKDRIRYKLPVWVTNTYDNICYWLNPRQKWLTKQIPNRWIEKEDLWDICILRGIVHHVEEDGGLGFDFGDYEKSQKDPDYPEHQKAFDREMKWAYDQIVTTLPGLEFKLQRLCDRYRNLLKRNKYHIPHSQEMDEISDEMEVLGKKIYDLKTKIMVWAIEKRNCIWT